MSGSRKYNSGSVSLWDLLTALSGSVAIAGAWSAVESVGWIGFLLGLVIGMCTGIGCFFGIRIVGNYVFRRLLLEAQKSPAVNLNPAYRLLYLVAFVWVIVSGFFGYYIAKLFIR
jgi:hypothetical protein